MDPCVHCHDQKKQIFFLQQSFTHKPKTFQYVFLQLKAVQPQFLSHFIAALMNNGCKQLFCCVLLRNTLIYLKTQITGDNRTPGWQPVVFWSGSLPSCATPFSLHFGTVHCGYSWQDGPTSLSKKPSICVFFWQRGCVLGAPWPSTRLHEKPEVGRAHLLFHVPTWKTWDSKQPSTRYLPKKKAPLSVCCQLTR